MIKDALTYQQKAHSLSLDLEGYAWVALLRGSAESNESLESLKALLRLMESKPGRGVLSLHETLEAILEGKARGAGEFMALNWLDNFRVRRQEQQQVRYFNSVLRGLARRNDPVGMGNVLQQMKRMLDKFALCMHVLCSSAQCCLSRVTT
jgi:hypothetical protein